MPTKMPQAECHDKVSPRPGRVATPSEWKPVITVGSAGGAAPCPRPWPERAIVGELISRLAASRSVPTFPWTQSTQRRSPSAPTLSPARDRATCKISLVRIGRTTPSGAYRSRFRVGTIPEECDTPGQIRFAAVHELMVDCEVERIRGILALKLELIAKHKAGLLRSRLRREGGHNVLKLWPERLLH